MTMSFYLLFPAFIFLSRALCKQEKEWSEANADGDFMTTTIQFQSPLSNAILRDYFVPVPAPTNMYWVGESETESKADHNVGCEAADQGSDIRVKRLASLGFHCVGQLDGTMPPSAFNI